MKLKPLQRLIDAAARNAQRLNNEGLKGTTSTIEERWGRLAADAQAVLDAIRVPKRETREQLIAAVDGALDALESDESSLERRRDAWYGLREAFYPDTTVERVVATHPPAHVDDHVAALRRCHRVLESVLGCIDPEVWPEEVAAITAELTPCDVADVCPTLAAPTPPHPNLVAKVQEWQAAHRNEQEGGWTARHEQALRRLNKAEDDLLAWTPVAPIAAQAGEPTPPPPPVPPVAQAAPIIEVGDWVKTSDDVLSTWLGMPDVVHAPYVTEIRGTRNGQPFHWRRPTPGDTR